MTVQEIRGVLADCAGNPSSGPICEALDAMALAMWEALNPKKATETKSAKSSDTAENTDPQ